MPTLVPMSREAFQAFASQASAGYAQDHVRAGNWSSSEAVSKATAQFDDLLPQGIDTPDHFFFEVHDASGRAVGTVWFAVVGAGEAGAGYVYDIRIRPDCQGRGHGKRALRALESIAVDMGVPALRLNVFAHNPRAEALYRSLGYIVTSSSMRKILKP